MHTISDDDFAKLAGEALDSLPEKFLQHVRNVAIVYADEPTPEQRVKLKLRDDQTLFGLYEGIPQIQRGANYNMVLPDKITIRQPRRGEPARTRAPYVVARDCASLRPGP